MNTATATTETEADETIRTKSNTPWTIESIGDQLKFSEDQLAECGNNRPEVQDGEKVLGKAPEAAKRFFALGEKYIDDAKEFAKSLTEKIEAFEDSNDSGNKQAFDAFADELHHEKHRLEEMESKGQFFANLGWMVIRDHFGWTCDNSYGMRKGWTVVEPTPQDSLGELLGLEELFGGEIIGIGIGVDKNGKIR